MDNVSDVDDLLVDLSDNSGQLNDLLLDDWFVIFRGSWEFDLQLVNSHLDNLNLLEEFGDLFLEDLDNLFLRWGTMSWDSWPSEWFLDNSSVSNSNDCFSDVVDSLSDSSNDSSQDNNSLLEFRLSLVFLDDLSDLDNLLSEDGDLLSQSLDNNLMDWCEDNWHGADFSFNWMSANMDDVSTGL